MGNPAATLATALLGFFVVTLDAVIVNVALPDIRADLGGGIRGLQWVVDGYTLMFAGLLLSSGSLSDRLGAKRAFGFGVLAFVLASAVCGALIAALMVLVGLAGPTVIPPVTAGLLNSVPASRSGTASGVFNTSRQVGGALAVAVFGALLATPAGFDSGLRLSLLIAAVIGAGAAVTALVGLPTVTSRPN